MITRSKRDLDKCHNAMVIGTRVMWKGGEVLACLEITNESHTCVATGKISRPHLKSHI